MAQQPHPLASIHLKEVSARVRPDHCWARMFFEAFAYKSPKLEETQMSLSKSWVNKLWCIHTGGSYTAARKEQTIGNTQRHG